GIESWGIEADPNVRTIADHFGLQVHIGNIYDLPFPDMKFDLIVLNQVLEHVPDPSAMLQAVRERLTPQGRVIMAFPNTGSFHHKIWKDRWINWHIPYHQNHFNRPEIRRNRSDVFDLVTKLAGEFGKRGAVEMILV
ncbi:class I SAM-dependent methyltransferase, partial [Rhizobium ruizarguesonis]